MSKKYVRKKTESDERSFLYIISLRVCLCVSTIYPKKESSKVKTEKKWFTKKSWNPKLEKWNNEDCVRAECAKCKWRMEMAPCCDMPIFPWNRAVQKNRPSYESPHPLQLKKLKSKTRKMKTMKTVCRMCKVQTMSWNCEITAEITAWPPAMKLSNYSMGLLPWNRQITAWAFYREIVKLQHGPSTVKSSNCSMGHLPWNLEITGWTASHEIVKSKHEPIAVKMSNCSMGLLPWNRQITAWIIWREIIKLQHGPSAMKSWNHRMERLPWNCQIIA